MEISVALHTFFTRNYARLTVNKAMSDGYLQMQKNFENYNWILCVHLHNIIMFAKAFNRNTNLATNTIHTALSASLLPILTCASHWVN